MSNAAEKADSGRTGSVDLGINVGAVSETARNEERTDESGAVTGGTIDVGIAVGKAELRTVSFVGIYYGDDGMPDAEKGRETIRTVEAAEGTTPQLPSDVDVDREGYWADAWYAEDPAAHEGLSPVALADITVEGDTALYCRWMKGYAVRLDPNNGDASSGLDGAVESPAYVMVSKDPDYDQKIEANGNKPPEGVDQPAGVPYASADADARPGYDRFPVATRPGYVFKGWYWPETETVNGREVPKTDPGDHGRVVLDEKAGMVAPAVGEDGSLVYEGEMSYVDIHNHNGQTLYAKWEIAPAVRIELDHNRDDYKKSIWFWPGRGYSVSEPADGLEADSSAVLAAPGEFDPGVTANPTPQYNTQYFTGWGYKDAKVGDAYKDDVLLACEKVEDGSGESDQYVYRLTERAFEAPYVDAGKMEWIYGSGAEGGQAREAFWEVLAGTAHIRVKAPFEVTFEKAGAGYDFENNPDAVEPYSLDELDWEGGKAAGDWIQSLPQGFTNLGERSVYVSRIDCVDVGASAILPGGVGGKRLLRLSETEGEPNDAGDAKDIKFGYASVSNANVGDAGAYSEGASIVLPAAAEGADPTVKRLFFELNLRDAKFNRAAIAVGDIDDDNRYIAKIANVKYTYSVVP